MTRWWYLLVSWPIIEANFKRPPIQYQPFKVGEFTIDNTPPLVVLLLGCFILSGIRRMTVWNWTIITTTTLSLHTTAQLLPHNLYTNTTQVPHSHHNVCFCFKWDFPAGRLAPLSGVLQDELIKLWSVTENECQYDSWLCTKIAWC